MKKIISLLMALVMLVLCACGNGKEDTPAQADKDNSQGDSSNAAPDVPAVKGEAQTTPSPNIPDTAAPPDATQPLEWTDHVFTGTFSDETVAKEPLVVLSVYLPKVKGNEDIQLYYQNQLDRMKELGQTTYLDLGRGNYQFASQGIGIFSPVTVELGYKVLRNDGKLFSVRREIYENTGGAHPSVVLSSETFRVSDGALMIFSDLFTVSFDDATAKLTPMIEQMMDEKTKENGEEYYFENAKKDLFAMWDHDDWYLTDEHLVMYWQTYAISPYVAGLQEFFIPLESIADIFDAQWIS